MDDRGPQDLVDREDSESFDPDFFPDLVTFPDHEGIVSTDESTFEPLVYRLQESNNPRALGSFRNELLSNTKTLPASRSPSTTSSDATDTSTQISERKSRKPRTTHATTPYPSLPFPGQSFWSLSGSSAPTRKPRSCFTAGRRREVRQVRTRGACLRCTLLKRRCSGEDPCTTCLRAADVGVKSKALTWMECIRPSFDMTNVFEAATSTQDRLYFENIAKVFSDVNVRFNARTPFNMEVQRIVKQFSHLTMKEGALDPKYDFRIAGLLSVANFSNLMRPLLDTWIGRYAKAFLHLSVHLYAVDCQRGFREYPLEHVLAARSHLASVCLSELEKILKPSKLESLRDKLQVLRALFLVLVVARIAMRYRAPEVRKQTQRNRATESKDDALERLLVHYLIYVGSLAGLLHPVDEAVETLNSFTPAASIREFYVFHEQDRKSMADQSGRLDPLVSSADCFFCRPCPERFQFPDLNNLRQVAYCCVNCRTALQDFEARQNRRPRSQKAIIDRMAEDGASSSGDWLNAPNLRYFDLRYGHLDRRWSDEIIFDPPLSDERPEVVGWEAFRICCMHHVKGGDRREPCGPGTSVFDVVDDSGR